MARSGLLIIISAPSGTGKSTLCRKLISIFPDACYSVSVTARPPRRGEIDGKDYFFVSKNEFIEKKRKGELAEWALVHGHYYGTPKDFLNRSLSKGKDVILAIDVKGAMKLKKKYPEAITIFIAPPSLSELERRLRERGKDSKATIRERLINAQREISRIKKYDYLVVNERLEDALKELKCIIITERSRVEKSEDEIKKLGLMW